MNQIQIQAGGRDILLFQAEEPNRPLIIQNAFPESFVQIVKAYEETGLPDVNLALISVAGWDREMTPWDCRDALREQGGLPLFPSLKSQDAGLGGAEQYLKTLTKEILPALRERIAGVPPFHAITGYSLAGLFALYALYADDTFDRAASVSGSLWFPGFRDFVKNHEMKRKPDRVYLSLGDKECRTKNPLMRTVQESTEEIFLFFKEQGIDVAYELNPGNHFKDEGKRIMRGIGKLVE